MKRNDVAYKILWAELNALEELKQKIEKQIDVVVLQLKEFKIPE